MYNIYIIKNKINDKVYIGKTSKDIEIRFKQHKEDSYRFKERKLYKAMNEYGFSNFYIELLDKTENNKEASNLEIFYIKKFNSYTNGYNGNLGGDGKKLIDESLWNEIIEFIKLKKDFFVQDICYKFNLDWKTVKCFLDKNNIIANKFDYKKERIKELSFDVDEKIIVWEE